MSFDERVAQLREILSKDGSQATWQKLWTHLSLWPEEEVELAIRYTEQHIQEHWDLTLCKLENPPDTIHQVHQLIRFVTLDEKDLEKEHLWDTLAQYKNLQILDMKDCEDPNATPPLHFLPGLKELSIHAMALANYQESFESLPKGITKLSIFWLEGNYADLMIRSLSQLEALQELQIENWENMDSCEDPFSALAQHPNLRKLSLIDCECSTLDFLTPLTQLTEVSFTKNDGSYCELSCVEGLRSLTQLTKLTLDCGFVKHLDALSQLRNLTTLVLHGPQGDVADLFQEMHNLQELSLYGAIFFPKEWEVGRLRKLTKLVVEDLDFSEELDIYGLNHLSNLKELSLSWFHIVDREEEIAALTKLEKLTLRSCYHLKDLDFLQGLRGLKELSISECKDLESMGGLVHLPYLQKLSFLNCDFPSKAQTPTHTTMQQREEVREYQEQLHEDVEEK